MVPLPNSIDDHQMANARALESDRRRLAAAGKHDCRRPRSPRSWKPLSPSPRRLERRRAAAKSLGQRDAADRLADLVDRLLPQDARAALPGGTH